MNIVIRIQKCGHKHTLDWTTNLNDFRCPTPVRVRLPCGHQTTKKPCHVDIKEWKCDAPCDARVEPCGHSCLRKCHVNDDPDHTRYKCYQACQRIRQDCSTNSHKCSKKCYEKCSPCRLLTKKELPNCAHKQVSICCEKLAQNICNEPCKRVIRTCGHKCKRKCFEPCGDCDRTIGKTLSSCRHKVKTKCSESASIQNCHGACPKLLPCGHICKKKCNEVCTELCCELVEHTKPVFYGHKFKVECHLLTQQLPSYSSRLLQFCKEPCTAVLNCSHKCSGTCGECAQGRIHATCMEKCRMDLICGHECTLPCREVCQPCQLKCGFRCSHNKCNKKCSEVCTNCPERCTRRCKHVSCTTKCGNMCTVPPCQEACEKRLPCLHPCVGFCGDPCPPLCRICNADELTKVFLGYEDQIDARFVLLDECKHVIESKGIELYCEQDGSGDKGINYRRCPKCGTPITSTQRYRDYVKQAIKDVAVIKSISSGSYEEIQAKHQEVQNKLDAIQVLQQDGVFLTFEGIDEFLKEFDDFLQPIRRNSRQMFDLTVCKTLEAKLTIVQNIGRIFQVQNLKICRGFPSTSTNNIISEATNYVECLLKRLTKHVEIITNQELQDFKREQGRLLRIAQLIKISERFPNCQYSEIRELIYRPVIYTEFYDELVKIGLLELFTKMYLSMGLLDLEQLEMQQATSATGLKRGRWYKSPNGADDKRLRVVISLLLGGNWWQVHSCEDASIVWTKCEAKAKSNELPSINNNTIMWTFMQGTLHNKFFIWKSHS